MSVTDQVRELYLRLLRGWNNRNEAAIAKCFSDDGIMIGFDGSIAQGRTAIRNHLSPIFANHPTARFVAIVRVINEMNNSGILLADAGMIPPEANQIIPAANARQTIVAEVNSERLDIKLFQNTPVALHWDENSRQELSVELNNAFRERGLLPE
ncbi:SgcJ/EcaC family oxidoreductase [Acuticoccus sediminis]|uniref:SgcJ/EcaC family oxidoreductase n=1 Tax=Acuticoccus sediminis TaxID=2184697 RepID=UPI001CFF1F81|nr:SgcJ/EcaC family oxidoreductase [Acuticoccus sediminis]